MAVNRFLNIRRPLSVQILVTKFCDMTCNMCFTYPIDSKEKFKNTIEPSFEQLKYLIEESCKIGAQVIIPFGGEPLIRKDIGKIIDEISVLLNAEESSLTKLLNQKVKTMNEADENNNGY